MGEFSLHGSPVLVSALLECLCSLGARLAEPGEFTMRAFLHGRMDLAQAEAVHDIIESTTLFQAQVAARQHSGEISRALQPLKSMLVGMIVKLESAVEFPDEDLELGSNETLGRELKEAQEELKKLVDSFRRGRIVREGFNIAIVGRPNVGKSSLFNALLAQDRSIVTETPGTTRDLVAEYTIIDGIPVRLVDTAGIEDSEDDIEKLGVERSYGAIADADAVILVVDRSQPHSPEDDALKKRVEALLGITVMNKSDLGSRWSPEEEASYTDSSFCIEVSAKSGRNLEVLRAAIPEGFFGDAVMHQEGALITNLRHHQCLVAAEHDVMRAAASLRQGFSEEFALVDLHGALQRIAAITGETSVGNLLDEIFSQFCIGK